MKFNGAATLSVKSLLSEMCAVIMEKYQNFLQISYIVNYFD